MRARLPARQRHRLSGRHSAARQSVASRCSGWAGCPAGRLDDAEGWPVATLGPADSLRPASGADIGCWCRRSGRGPGVGAAHRRATPVAITGHGPHPLAFDTTAHATWREPAGRDSRASRTAGSSRSPVPPASPSPSAMAWSPSYGRKPDRRSHSPASPSAGATHLSPGDTASKQPVSAATTGWTTRCSWPAPNCSRTSPRRVKLPARLTSRSAKRAWST